MSKNPADPNLTEAEKRQIGLEVVAKFLPPEVVHGMDKAVENTGFASYMSELALKNVFSEIWARPGLDFRSRSLVTLGILIALRATDELRFHVAIALRNGCTVEEIEEVLYHSSAYAGFPAANSARAVAAEVIDKAWLKPDSQ
jgi:4-carboxymuconolactone decarboxylase